MILVFSIYVLNLISSVDTCSWGYNLTDPVYGPSGWGTMCERIFSSCGGNSQSPIDIVTSTVGEKNNEFIAPVFRKTSIIGYMENTERSVQFTPNDEIVDFPLTYNGEEFNFLQFHYHYLSEHTINGENKELEIHFVHVNEIGDAISVVGILFEAKPEHVNNPFLEQFENHLPNIPQEGYEDINIDFSIIFKETKTFYHYDGSLTTPPCSQAVNWFVMEEIQPATLSQLNKFNLFSEGKEEPGNMRPVLPLNSRIVDKIDGKLQDDNNNPDNDSGTLIYAGIVLFLAILVKLSWTIEYSGFKFQ